MITKQYFKTKDICRVRFKLDKKRVGPAATINLVGEFNDWNETATPMNKLKNGDFSLALDLAPDQAYQFRYLIDHDQWVNDEEADAYLPSPFPGQDNSVITL